MPIGQKSSGIRIMAGLDRMNLTIEPATAHRPPAETAVAEAPASRTTGEFGGVLRKLFKGLRYASLAMIGISALVIVREVASLHGIAHDVHPALGWVFLGGVGVLVWIGVVRPVRRYWAVPAAIRPPKSVRLATATAADVARRARFLAKVAENLTRNPRLVAVVPEILLAQVEAERLSEAARAGVRPADELKRDLRALETIRFESIFKPLDVEANQVIRGEALAVGLGTAVSMNGTFDAWIVLWRNLSLVSKLASIYYGRPGVRGTLFVIRDVATAMLIATKLQGAVEGATNFLGSWFGRAGSAIVGPVADGAVNALVTVRIGYVAKARCRSFRVWTDTSLRTILVDCFKEAGSHGKGVVFDVLSGTKGGIKRAGSEVWQRASGLVSKFFTNPNAPIPAAE